MCLFHAASVSLLIKQEVPTALAQVALTVMVLKESPRIQKGQMSAQGLASSSPYHSIGLCENEGTSAHSLGTKQAAFSLDS